MTWIKLDDQFFAHPKIRAAGATAVLLHLAGLTYCGRYKTDGRVPKSAVTLIAVEAFAKPGAVTRLVDVGLWHDLGDEFEIHDFLDYNPSKAEVDSRRDSKRIAGAIGAAKRWGNSTHSSCQDNGNAPVPSRPVPCVPSVRARSLGTRISDEFVVTDEMVAWVEADCPTVHWQSQTEAWVDWAKSTPGAKARKTDWVRAWKNAMRRKRDEART